MNRPEKRNALDAEMISEVKDAVRACVRDESVRVVLIGGAGTDFCSGADLSGLHENAGADVLKNMDDARNMAALFIEMRHHPRPIVAAVRGRALAGGCGLATAADLVPAAGSAEFRYPEVKIRLAPPVVVAPLPRARSPKPALPP